MPVDLCGSINKTSRWAFASPILNSILGSSLFVAIIIAFLMVLIIMVMYPAKTGTSFGIVVKMFIYMLFSSMLVVFLHDCVVKSQINEQHDEDSATDFMRNATMEGRQNDPSYASTYKPINPAINLPQNNQQSIKGGAVNDIERYAPGDITEYGDITEPTISIVEGGSSNGRNLRASKPPRRDFNPFNLK
jgi:hypothetical protein